MNNEIINLEKKYNEEIENFLKKSKENINENKYINDAEIIVPNIIITISGSSVSCVIRNAGATAIAERKMYGKKSLTWAK